MNKVETAAKIAEFLLQIKAVKLSPSEPFTWASGWRSPIYCDNRVSLSHPFARTFVKESLAALSKKHYPDADAIVGVATAGIAPGALVADLLGLPFGYVRPEPKKHGMGKRLEGDIAIGSKVVVLEDLVSTGKSSLASIEALREEGCEVLGLIAVFSYGFEQAELNFSNANCPFQVLCDYETLIATAIKTGDVQLEQLETLSAWRQSPSTWRQEV